MIAPSLTPGGLIGLCSPSHVARRGVYAPILDALRSRGYRVESLAEVLSLDNCSITLK